MLWGEQPPQISLQLICQLGAQMYSSITTAVYCSSIYSTPLKCASSIRIRGGYLWWWMVAYMENRAIYNIIILYLERVKLEEFKNIFITPKFINQWSSHVGDIVKQQMLIISLLAPACYRTVLAHLVIVKTQVMWSAVSLYFYQHEMIDWE